MKKRALLVGLALVLVLLLAGCGSQDGTTPSSPPTTTQVSDTPTTGMVTTSTSPAPTEEVTATSKEAASTTAPKPTRVFAPHELLSAEEAGEVINQPDVQLDPGSLYKDEARGVVSERYVYDLDGTGIHALVEIYQDSLRTEGSVAEDFAFEKKLSASSIESVAVGDDAFSFTSTGQFHLLWHGYYIVVAFEVDPYDSAKAKLPNQWLGKRILTNLQAALK